MAHFIFQHLQFKDKLTNMSMTNNKTDLLVSLGLSDIETLRNNVNKISLYGWEYLCHNPNAIDFLEENPDKITWSYLAENTDEKSIKLIKKHIENFSDTFLSTDWNLFWRNLYKNPKMVNTIKEITGKTIDFEWIHLSQNFGAIELLEKNKENIYWYHLSRNPAAIKLIEENNDKINWFVLPQNPEAMDLIKNNLDKIIWNSLCINQNPEAIELIKNNLDKINSNGWEFLSLNPAAISILENNPENIRWYLLSENPEAIHLLEANKDKINWSRLTKNPAARHLLEQYPEKVYPENLKHNYYTSYYKYYYDNYTKKSEYILK